MSTKITLAAVAAGLMTSMSLADTTTETFSGGSNEGGWTWGCCMSTPASGGNPGSYLRAVNIDAFAPQPRTTSGGAFTGDYRAMGVTSVGIDLITFDADFSVGGRPCTLMLIHDNGTPANELDDTAAYFMHPDNIPFIGAGWQPYDFDVPSRETVLPAGWVLLNMGDSGSPANHTWDQVIQAVDQVKFFYGNPEFFFIFQQWTLGMDNVRVTGGPVDGPCDGDVNEDGAVDVDDIVDVVLAWGTCFGCPEDITGDDRVDIDDLVEVVLAFGPCL